MIQTGTLPSGIRLVTETMGDVRSVSVGFWVGAGSRDENEELAGASHFLEHLLFKGTPKRSAVDIAEALDEVGGDCNAFTTKEYTTFYTRLLARDLPLGLDILSEIMWDPALAKSDVDAERSVILDEILMHADDPGDLVGELWQAAMFPEHPLGRDTLGTALSVSKITPEDIRTFFSKHYLPGNIVVAVAGQCGYDEVAHAIEERFVGSAGGVAPFRTSPDIPAKPLVVASRSTEQANLLIGTRSVSRYDDRRWALAVFNHVLGGGLSSRLFQKVREQRGLAYSIWSERMAFEDTGSLAVGVGTAPENVEEVLKIVVEELALLANKGITDKELSIAKGNLVAETLLSGEDSASRMTRLGSALLLHNKVRTIDEILDCINSVNKELVKNVANDIYESSLTLAAVGPFDEGFFVDGSIGSVLGL